MERNRFLRFGAEDEGDMPGRLYARLDRSDDDRVYLDAIDANWFDAAMGPEPTWRRWLDSAANARVYILETDVARYSQGAGYDTCREEELLEDGEHEWLQLTITAGGDDALLYANLFARGIPTGLQQISPVPPATRRSLDSAFTLDPYLADQAGIETALSSLRATIEWIGVYDVGQGSANGLCDAIGFPRAYFDLGGGVLANTHTFPSALTNFCFTQHPLILLSHWDWDHWSSGARFPAATQMTWVVPHQSLGAVHATQAAAIASNGQLLVWPAGLASLQVGQASIIRCTGHGRNHSGLAVAVQGPRGEDPILMTGDARYAVIPGAVANRYTSVVVPHHGADMRNRSTPIGPRLPASRAAYSYGAGNSFKHPRSVTEADHHGNGWPHSSRHAASPADRHTVRRSPAGLGHIGLTWGTPGTLPAQPCGSIHCALQLIQT